MFHGRVHSPQWVKAKQTRKLHLVGSQFNAHDLKSEWTNIRRETQWKLPVGVSVHFGKYHRSMRTRETTSCGVKYVPDAVLFRIRCVSVKLLSHFHLWSHNCYVPKFPLPLKTFSTWTIPIKTIKNHFQVSPSPSPKARRSLKHKANDKSQNGN